MLRVLDSSAWIELLGNIARGSLFAPAASDVANLLVPTICILEVLKWVRRERGEADALRTRWRMLLGRVIALDAHLASQAAEFQLPLADSVIYATSCQFHAELRTQDAHFEGLPNVRFFPKLKAP